MERKNLNAKAQRTQRAAKNAKEEKVLATLRVRVADQVGHGSADVFAIFPAFLCGLCVEDLS